MQKSNLYRKVSLIRQFELKIVEVYPTDIMQTPVHLSIGQESVAAALCAHLGTNDLAMGTHRGHGLYLAKGGSLVAMFAELLGRVDGCSGGYGGSMHLIDQSCGMMGTSSIVGGSIPIIVGVAKAIKLPNVAAVLFGDGASDEGAFYEALNFAQLKKLPVIFLCENNRYSVYTPSCDRRCARPSSIAEGCGMKTIYTPIEVSNDVFALDKVIKSNIEHARKGNGPVFFECETVRAVDHHGGGSDVEAGFRPSEEAALAAKFDPYQIARKGLGEKEADRIDAEVKKEIEEAFQKALKSSPLVIQEAYEQLGNNAWTA